MKLNKLLPVVALSSIASIAVPIASCSCNPGGGNTPEPQGEEIKLDKICTKYPNNMACESSTQTFEKDKIYTAIIDTSILGVTEKVWALSIIDMEKPEEDIEDTWGSMSSENAMLWYDGEKIELSEEQHTRFYRRSEANHYSFNGEESAPIPRNIIIKVQFSPEETITSKIMFITQSE